MNDVPTALVADDEPLLRGALIHQLSQVWPELEIVAEARNGREAVEQFEVHHPDVCFLDVHMPGISGIEAARLIGDRAHLVFVTAYDQYAVQAFAEGVLDYLVKPIEIERLRATTLRLKTRMDTVAPVTNTDALLKQLAVQLRQDSAPASLRWIRAQVGSVLRLIPVEDVDYLRADTKYTLIAWRDDTGKPAEALIRTPLRELASQLDAEQFIQVHRSYVVNFRAVDHVVRGEYETASIHLKHRSETVPVSRSYLHLFRQM
ncbi:MAG: response regulator transcription factor [Burkholderiales bacterium]|nr:response regulator transcription factor [Burkholderiales bacterium]